MRTTYLWCFLCAVTSITIVRYHEKEKGFTVRYLIYLVNKSILSVKKTRNYNFLLCLNMSAIKRHLKHK